MSEKSKLNEEELTPKKIVEYLDKFIIGQEDAKKSVAIALRNRWRRKQVPIEMRDEIMPKNIILIGSTGVGKTEIARRIAKLVNAPFVKVEASKYTEVGYVGRDVESMIRDLTEISLSTLKKEKMEACREKAMDAAVERVLNILLPAAPKSAKSDSGTKEEQENQSEGKTREKFRNKIKEEEIKDKKIEIDAPDKPHSIGVEVFPMGGFENLENNIKDMISNFSSFAPKNSQKKKVTVEEALKIFQAEEAEKMIAQEDVQSEAVRKVEESGIVFLDEIDKVANRRDATRGGDVSREGVQRDLLPIVEGSSINTRHGTVKTDHVLFIAAGAFHVSKPSDLIPELQGRFPIRVEMKSLSKDDFLKILTAPDNSLTKQYMELMATEGVELEFLEDGIDEIADSACKINQQNENIGARRLHTILENILEEASFSAPEMKGQKVTVSRQYVLEKLSEVMKDQDLSKYIL